MNLLRIGTLLVLALTGCTGSSSDGEKPGIFEDNDADNDGYVYADDCDDDNPSIHPDAAERCDSLDVDEDCDGLADNADPDSTGGLVVYHDADGDGFGEDGSATAACEPSTGYVLVDGDCDDGDPTINAGADEVCDGSDIDEDCNGLADDDDPNVLAADQEQAWPDTDGDGFGSPEGSEYFCDAPAGWVDDDSDCDDTLDFVNPGASEVCDRVDDDCDGLSDEADALDTSTWYADADGDGYGNLDSTRNACDRPRGFVGDDTDCDDRAIGVFPGAAETCDGEDDNCDGTVDEDDSTDVSTWYRDSDSDGYGDVGSPTNDCSQPSGYVANDDDCNDATASISPARTEACDAGDIDEDCDGLSDDDDRSVSSSGMTTYYADDDGDTYGDPDDSDAACDLPSGYVTNANDCDDRSSSINPAGSEICDSSNTDEDCDGVTDDDDGSVSAAGKSTFYRDADADGYGVSTASVSKCDKPSGYSSYSTDCDDASSARSPANYEVCDSANLDEDCDSLSDDSDPSVNASTRTTWYADADADGYGLAATTKSQCDQPAGYGSGSGDCDDADADVNPGEIEVCFDSVDDNCDSSYRCDRDSDSNDLQLIGETTGDNAGASVANAGDVNNDGIDDVAVGALYNDAGGTDAGAAYVYTTHAVGDVDLSAVNAILVGEDSTDMAGGSVAGIGDFNADGKDDILVGATGDDDGGTNAGKAYLVRGRQTSIDLSISYAKFIGENASDAAGVSVAGPGDVSGDGYPDMLIGASGRSSNAGGAYLLTSAASGSTDLSLATAILTGETSSDYAGLSLDGAGDVNADGYDDMIVGAYGDDDGASSAGAAYIVLGPQTGTASLSTSDAKRYGVASSDYAGYVVSGGGDINNDGYDDVIIGAYGYGSYGAVYIELGPVTGSASLSGADARIDGTASLFGKAAALGGDVDGDGYADIAVGDATADNGGTDTGSVWLFLGPVSGTITATSADARVSGSVAGDGFGASVGFIGAQDGTAGVSDLLVGATYEDDGGSAAGSAYVFSAGF